MKTQSLSPSILRPIICLPCMRYRSDTRHGKLRCTLRGMSGLVGGGSQQPNVDIWLSSMRQRSLVTSYVYLMAPVYRVFLRGGLRTGIILSEKDRFLRCFHAPMKRELTFITYTAIYTDVWTDKQGTWDRP